MSNPSWTTWSPLWQTEHEIMSLNLLLFTKVWSSRKKEWIFKHNACAYQ
jgi:hypothetical protein